MPIAVAMRARFRTINNQVLDLSNIDLSEVDIKALCQLIHANNHRIKSVLLANCALDKLTDSAFKDLLDLGKTFTLKGISENPISKTPKEMLLHLAFILFFHQEENFIPFLETEELRPARILLQQLKSILTGTDAAVKDVFKNLFKEQGLINDGQTADDLLRLVELNSSALNQLFADDSVSLKGKAFWGKLAYNFNHPLAGKGAFYYGKFLLTRKPLTKLERFYIKILKDYISERGLRPDYSDNVFGSSRGSYSKQDKTQAAKALIAALQTNGVEGLNSIDSRYHAALNQGVLKQIIGALAALHLNKEEISEYHLELEKEEMTTLSLRSGFFWFRIAWIQYGYAEAKDTIKPIENTEARGIARPEELKPVFAIDKFHRQMALMEYDLQMAKRSEDKAVYQPLDDLFGKLDYFRSWTFGAYCPLHAGFTSKVQMICEKFYYQFLLHDELSSAALKLEAIDYLSKEKKSLIPSLKYFYPKPFKETRIILTRYAERPLGIFLAQTLLPLLEKENNGLKINPKKPIEQCSELERSVLFCQEALPLINQYLEKGELFGQKITAQENDSYMALLMQQLLQRLAKKFLIHNSKLATDIQGKIASLKQQIQRSFFRCQSQKKQPLTFDLGIKRRLGSYYTAGQVNRVATLKTHQFFKSMHETSQTGNNKPSKLSLTANGVALGVEFLHLTLPIIGIGLKSIQSLHMAYKAVHTIEHAMEHDETIKYTANFFPKLLHALHFKHALSHSHEEVSLEDFLRYFADLLDSVGSENVDISQLVLQHYFELYKPALNELSKESQYLLGDLLFALLFKGLQYRMSYHKKNRESLPKSLPELMNYFDESLWRYSPLASEDNITLLKDGGKVVSVLDIIFPKRVKVQFMGRTVTLKLQTKHLPDHQLEKNADFIPARFASAKEVEYIEAYRKDNTRLLPLALIEIPRSMQINPSIEVRTAFKDPLSIESRLNILISDRQVYKLMHKTDMCWKYINSIKKQLNKGELKEKAQVTLNRLTSILPVLNNTLTQLTASSQSECKTLNNWQPFAEIETNLNRHSAIDTYLDKVLAMIILLDRHYSLSIPGILDLPLARLDSESLYQYSHSLGDSYPLLSRETLSNVLMLPSTEVSDEGTCCDLADQEPILGNADGSGAGTDMPQAYREDRFFQTGQLRRRHQPQTHTSEYETPTPR